MKKIILTTLLIVFYFLPTKLNAEIRPITEGNIDAKIKIVVFESLTCGHCAKFHKDVYPGLKENFIDKGHVYIEFKNFPLDKFYHLNYFHIGCLKNQFVYHIFILQLSLILEFND